LHPGGDVIASFEIAHRVGALAINHLSIVVVAQHGATPGVATDLELPAAVIDELNFADDIIVNPADAAGTLQWAEGRTARDP
jgi:hypothetical protein